VWRADLEAVGDQLDGLLCAAELERAGRMLRERDRQLWVRSRGVLRALLGRYLQADPAALRFAAGAHGKPALLEDEQAPTLATQLTAPGSRLSFNLSHSGQLALYAFSGSGEVGVDVEVSRRSLDEVALAERVFEAAEAERLEGLDPAIRQQEFRRLWTRHEAVLKLRGTGIGAQPRNVGLEPWIAELEIGSQAAGAVAIDEPPRELCCWDWT
jgi:4'-phosphopantetheinyl transferase